MNAYSVALYFAQLFPGLPFVRRFFHWDIARPPLSGDRTLCGFRSSATQGAAIHAAADPLHPAITIPISCLIVPMLLFQKLSHTHELTALRICGLGLKPIITPLFVLFLQAA